MDKKLAMVANESFPYAGRDLQPGDLFHVEHPTHGMIFRGTGQARNAKAEELPKGKAGDDTDPDSNKSKEETDKSLFAGPGGQYQTRDLALEAGRRKITRTH